MRGFHRRDDNRNGFYDVYQQLTCTLYCMLEFFIFLLLEDLWRKAGGSPVSLPEKIPFCPLPIRIHAMK